jgi:hypothetical protein
MRHPEADVVEVRAVVPDDWLEPTVRDDGVGSADPERREDAKARPDKKAAGVAAEERAPGTQDE